MPLSKSMILIIVLIVLTGVEGLAFFGVLSEYDDLTREFAVLQDSYAELGVSFHSLNESYQDLALEHAEMQSMYDSLENQYAELYEIYTSLSTEYGDLTNVYSELQTYCETEKALSLGNSLESYYDYVRETEGFAGKWYGDQRDMDFSAKLALHGLGYDCWPSLEDKYYKDVGTHSYIMAREKMDEVLDLIDVQAYDLPTEKISKILEFISDHISYEREIDNVYLAPAETLGFQSGDCDDFSILAAALFEAVGIDAAVGLFRNENEEYHTMVLVHLEDLEGYKYWKYDDLTNLGLREGRWIVIEPQRTIDGQGDTWIQQWNLLYAAPVD